MSPRKNRRATPPPPRPAPGGGGHVESSEDGDWQVRNIPGASSTKPYRCPGCDQEIPVGLPHIVAWNADAADATDRRHWHTPCWKKRHDRAPRTRRGPRH